MLDIQQIHGVKDLYSLAWESFKKNKMFFINTSLVYFLIYGLFAVADYFLPSISLPYSQELSWAWMIFKSIMGLFVQITFLRLYLLFVDGDKENVQKLFSSPKAYFYVFISSIITGIIVFFGLLLIVPGIIWALKYSMATYVIIDEDLGPIEALKRSSELTDDMKGFIFTSIILAALLYLAGFLAFFLGLFVAMPVVSLAYAYLYRYLQLRHKELVAAGAIIE